VVGAQGVRADDDGDRGEGHEKHPCEHGADAIVRRPS
jgi:hypothetical protein